MTIEEILGQLEEVRESRRGFISKCPSHVDRNPSLSIGQGRDGRILLNCWAGCRIQDICSALHIEMRDLFLHREQDPFRVRESIQQLNRERAARNQVRRMDGLIADARREAAHLIRSSKGMDTSAWSHDFLDVALNKLADAYELVGDSDE